MCYVSHAQAGIARKNKLHAGMCTTDPPLHRISYGRQVRVLAEGRSRVRQDGQTAVRIVRSVIQSVSKSANSLSDGSFELSSKRNSLSPWCINSACLCIVSYSSSVAIKGSWPAQYTNSFLCPYVWQASKSQMCLRVCGTACVSGAVRASVGMLLGIKSGCMFIFACNRICAVKHP